MPAQEETQLEPGVVEEVPPAIDTADDESPPEEAEPRPMTLPSGEEILPEDLIYQGAFRLPEASGGSDWDYSGHGLTFYPGGDPNNPDDGFPGSLYGVGHDQQLQVSEISIPAPVISKNLDDLNTAVTLQEFSDLTDRMFDREALALPRMGIEYLPAQGSQATDKLHFTYGQHIQDFEPSHGWSELDLSKPQAVGPWVFGTYSNYTTNDYLFEIPADWADAYTPGMYLGSGRFREGVWSGRGPAIYAYAPWVDGNPPGRNAELTTIKPLLLYGIQEPGIPDIVSDDSMQMNGYQESDHWLGAAWLSAGDKSALIFTGTKAMGQSWYGFANGVVWDYACADVTPSTCPEYPEWPYDDRGFWAEDYQAQLLFFNTNDLAAVAQGQMETYDPQPYASLDLTPYLYDPQLNHADYKRDLITAPAFDRENGILYVIERLADEYKSVIHTWKIE